MVFAVGRAVDVPIHVSGETLTSDGLTVWRRPVAASGWPVRKVRAPEEDYQDPYQEEENVP